MSEVLNPSQPDFEETLLGLAFGAIDLAYSPYSTGKVGAALLGASGRVYLGANIGNTSSPMNCCAEQAAIVQAVLAKDFPFQAIAIVQNRPVPCPPCGRCLQLLAEFAEEMRVITRGDGPPLLWPLSYLLPVPYRRADSSSPTKEQSQR